ncbi:TRAP transporter substrate-binding protein [Hominifimenecus sp. rT4P-3]|uniref:TRAP transporter substrate-binding protein n=1 Tax=Hominifimenecus sp. rT4P-3 TaxID=3242979 RepID=UPI003DA38BF3
MKVKSMKKTLAVLLAGTMLCGALASCGGSGDTTTAAPKTDAATTAAAKESEAATTAAATEAPATSDAEVVLQLAWGTADSDIDPFAIAAHAFQEIVEEKSGGRIKIEFYPNSVLGAERDTFEGISMGTIDMGLINNTPIGGFVPECQVLDLPYLFPDKETIWEIVDGEVGAKIDQAILDSYGVMSLGVYDGGFRQMYNNTRPIFTPSDMEGITMRSMENTVYLEMFKALGANPTAMAFTEIFTGLQQGTVDGFEIGISTYYSNNFQEVTKYMSLTNHTFTPIRLLIGADKFNSMPEDLQQILLDSVKESLPVARKTNADTEASMLDTIKAAGVEINEINDAAEFKGKCENIWYMFEDEVGSDLLKAVMDICTK